MSAKFSRSLFALGELSSLRSQRDLPCPCSCPESLRQAVIRFKIEPLGWTIGYAPRPALLALGTHAHKIITSTNYSRPCSFPAGIGNDLNVVKKDTKFHDSNSQQNEQGKHNGKLNSCYPSLGLYCRRRFH